MAPRRKMLIAFKGKLYLIGGVVFFILGVLGLFLPILQGVLFLLVSLILFARGSARGRMLRRRLIKRYPQWGSKLIAAEEWLAGAPHRIKRWFRRRASSIKVSVCCPISRADGRRDRRRAV